MRFIILLIVCLAFIASTMGCTGKSSSSKSSASSSSSSGTGDPNVFNRGSFNDGNPGNVQGQSVSVGVQCDSNGNCKKYENTQNWG